MPAYADRPKAELQELREALEGEYKGYQALGLALDMSRGKPSAAQLALSMPMLDILDSSSSCKSADGTECRNYGVMDGLPEAKELLATLLDDEAANVIVFGNASLNVMYDSFARCMAFGALGSTPWNKLPEVKWLCPVPGYDRHFGITEDFKATMVNVPMKDDGPDMDVVESLVKDDAAIKGIWCVPKYSNPEGVTYSDEVVRRMAAMDCAAEDFRIFWDNAYSVHHLYDDAAHQDQLLDIAGACREAGHPDRYFKFASTSKITFAGAGISGLATSPANLAEVKKHMFYQTIGNDKLNQLRHALFLKDADGIAAHMRKHAAVVRPKFELVLERLAAGLEGTGCGSWHSPR
ncbi:MAG: aminotransferase class I/II-fold pyridoxal phosphate-dependent enzyme, partial [Eggerthellaceae bacterium]|nr:aminotransferase class I/II-fold pyridoxal phosphate-dependent enzyme [Eggerthellaceae bacterium]